MHLEPENLQTVYYDIEAQPKRGFIFKCLFLKLLAFSGFILIVLSIIFSTRDYIDAPAIIPDWDLSKCSPLTNNTKRLWTYWHTGLESMPIFVRQNIQSWKNTHPDWEIRAITGIDSNSECHYSKFVQDEYMPKSFKDMLVQKQSDAVRLALIRLHGGIYLDATIMVLEPLEENFWNHVAKPDSDPDRKSMVGYYSEGFSLPGQKNGFEIWMIVARSHEPMVEKWHDMFLKLFESSPNPFIRDERTGRLNPMFEGADFHTLSEHFLNYGASTTILNALVQLDPMVREAYNHRSIIRRESDDAYRLNGELWFGWDTLYDFYCNPRRLSVENLKMVVVGTPLVKLVNHAVWIDDKRHEQWNILSNNLGLMRVSVAKKAQRYQRSKLWDSIGLF